MLTLRSQSFRRYRLADRLPSPHSDEFMRLLHERRFQPLGPSEERTYGWVTADNLLVTQFDVGTVILGAWAAFALRIDKRSVNRRLLRAHVDLEVEARRKASRDGGGRGRVSRDERRDLREGLFHDLLKKTSPSVDAVTVLLHSKRRLVHVLNLSRTTNELVVLHMLDTFGVPMTPLTPWRRSAELLRGTSLENRLDDLHRTDFTVLGGSSSDTRAADPVRGRIDAVPLDRNHRFEEERT